MITVKVGAVTTEAEVPQVETALAQVGQAWLGVAAANGKLDRLLALAERRPSVVLVRIGPVSEQ